MAEPPEFQRRINRIAARVAEGGDRAVRMAFLAIDQAVVLATPVDTSRARSNWLPNLDAPASGQIAPYVAGEKGSSAAASSEAAMDAAKAVAKKYDGDRNRELHITNNLPYIAKLNEGSSTQAPALFVETAVAAGAAAIRGVRIIV